MVRHDHPGLFIAFEGLGGSGVTIQARLLAEALRKEGYRVHHTFEPTNGLIGGLIKAQLSGTWKADKRTLQILFAADRSLHLSGEIVPALEAGRIVIVSRYVFSSIAYGSVEVHDQEWLKQLNQPFIEPDLTFVMKVRPKICALRLKQSHYELELYREEQKLTEVWSVYEDLMKDYPDIKVIHGERGEIEILHELKELTRARLAAGRKPDEVLDRSPTLS